MLHVCKWITVDKTEYFHLRTYLDNYYKGELCTEMKVRVKNVKLWINRTSRDLFQNENFAAVKTLNSWAKKLRSQEKQNYRVDPRNEVLVVLMHKGLYCGCLM